MSNYNNYIDEMTMLLDKLLDTEMVGGACYDVDSITDDVLFDEEPEIIFIDGTDDPFGINDVMIKMAEIMCDDYECVADNNDDTLVLDYTSLHEDEFHRILVEAIACVEFEKENSENNRINSESGWVS